MNRTMMKKVKRVAARMRCQRLADFAVLWFFYGILAASAIALGGLCAAKPFGFGALAALLALGVAPITLLGTLLTLRGNKRDIRRAAARIDDFGHFQDRTLTALELLTNESESGMARLQIADTERHIETIDPAAVVPLRVPRYGRRGIFATLTFAVISAVSIHAASHPTESNAEPDRSAARADSPPSLPADERAPISSDEFAASLSELQEKLLDPITRLSDRYPEEVPLEKLRKTLDLLADRLRAPGNNRIESLAALSEMGSALDETLRFYDTHEDERTLAEGGAAMTENPAAPIQNADKPAFDENAANNTAKSAENRAENSDRLAQRRKIAEALESRRDALSLLKSNVASSAHLNRSGQKGGNEAREPSQTGHDAEFSVPSRKERATGTPGNGPSEFETVESAEGAAPNEEVRRPRREERHEYQKGEESAMESAPIPLGRRRVVERYFDAITPEKR